MAHYRNNATYLKKYNDKHYVILVFQRNPFAFELFFCLTNANKTQVCKSYHKCMVFYEELYVYVFFGLTKFVYRFHLNASGGSEMKLVNYHRRYIYYIRFSCIIVMAEFMSLLWPFIYLYLPVMSNPWWGHSHMHRLGLNIKVWCDIMRHIQSMHLTFGYFVFVARGPSWV